MYKYTKKHNNSLMRRTAGTIALCLCENLKAVIFFLIYALGRKSFIKTGQYCPCQ